MKELLCQGEEWKNSYATRKELLCQGEEWKNSYAKERVFNKRWAYRDLKDVY